tara:strand:- start:461 stop:1147 length:687 start_codon:yes stop_codon:yes gene_type:complete
MLTTILALILAFLISITYYYSNKHSIKYSKKRNKIISFSAGVSITYVLLELFPTFTELASSVHKLLFLSILFGFIIHHVIEKEIHQHISKTHLKRVLGQEENVFSFVYHIIIGIVLVKFIKQDLIQSLLFFVPLASYTFLNTLPTKPHSSKGKSFFLAGATILGVIIGLFTQNYITIGLEAALIGLITGVLLFAVIRHHLPFGKEGEPKYFMVGFLIYSILIIVSWYI